MGEQSENSQEHGESTPLVLSGAAADAEPDVDEAESIIKIAGEFTKEASQAARQMGLAGLAVIWLFKLTSGAQFALPSGLFVPTSCFVLALGLDFLYWAVGALMWRLDYRFFQGGSQLGAWAATPSRARDEGRQGGLR